MGHPRASRQGLTLLELIVALSIFGVVISTAIAFMAQQNTAFQTAVHRLVSLRNLRYAVSTLTQDLETLGTNVPAKQPDLIYGDEDVVAFSADYATNVADDPFAVFYDPDAPSGQVRAPSKRFSIPNSSVRASDSIFEVAPGLLSPAEIVIFYVVEDASTSRTDDYILMRQVNANDPEPIAHNLLHTGSDPFFSYQYLAEDSSGIERVVAVPDSLMPVYHSAAYHLSVSDTGRSRVADNVRAVRLRFAATNGLSGPEEQRVELDRLVPLPNAGFGELATCGSPPILGTGLTLAAIYLPTGEAAVTLSWSAAVDETAGETDVVGYVIWRQQVGGGGGGGSSGWGDPYRSIPAGGAPYTYTDVAVEEGKQYNYALAAQDCTPSLSSLVTAGPVTP